MLINNICNKASLVVSTCSDLVLENVKNSTPEILQLASRHVAEKLLPNINRNSTFLKIITGLGATALGTNLIVKSKVIDRLSHKLLAKPVEQSVNWKAASIGLICSLGGISLIISGIFDILHKQYSFSNVYENNNLDSRSDEISIEENLFENVVEENLEESSENSTYIYSKGRISTGNEFMNDQIKEFLLPCSEGKELWTAVQNEGDFAVRVKDLNDLPENCPRACADTISRVIYINNEPKNLYYGKGVSNLVFELNNLLRAKKAAVINSEMCNLSVDEYVRKLEYLEYESALATHKIAAACIKKEIWPSSWDMFKEYVKLTAEESYMFQFMKGHSTGYIQTWSLRCKVLSHAFSA